MAEEATPGVTAPPAEPATPVAPAPTEPSPGTEPVTKPDDKQEQTVPFTRFQEVNDKARKAEEEAESLRQELASKSTPQTPQNADDDLDPETEDIIRRGAKKLGLVSKTELDERAVQLQVRQDVKDLESTSPNPGIPYNHKDVIEYAKTNNLPLTSKAVLTAAYRELNWDKIVEAERNKAIEGFKATGSSAAEKPGSTGPQPPSEPEVSGNSPRERTRSRIENARQKLQV